MEERQEQIKKLSTKIEQLVCYAIEKGFIEEEDRIFTRNQLLELFGEREFIQPPLSLLEKIPLEKLLEELIEEGVRRNLLEGESITQRDLFDTKLMGILVPRPSSVTKQFLYHYENSPKEAADYFYLLSCDSNYIRRDRIKKDLRWIVKTSYGDMDITINLSKPEKDPKAIAAAKNQKSGSYPLCLLCKENVGYAGHMTHPARQNHRVIPVKINGQKWALQYSPYVYYKEHCIVFNQEHTSMKIDKSTFVKLFDFVKFLPHYFVGSNADLPIVGGSILSHDHFQGGAYEFAMERANIRQVVKIPKFEDIEVGMLHWPVSVIRLRGKDENRLITLASHILDQWRGYSDEKVEILSQSSLEPHNTITPIARKKGDTYELDLALRNNRTTKEYPLGIFHPHQELHHIKKENIGLIEVMGLAVLPSRLKEEMELLTEYILEGKDISKREEIKKHEAWVSDFLPKYENIDRDSILDILKKEIGLVFEKVLEAAGVFKNTKEGQEAFLRFLGTL